MSSAAVASMTEVATHHRPLKASSRRRSEALPCFQQALLSSVKTHESMSTNAEFTPDTEPEKRRRTNSDAELLSDFASLHIGTARNAFVGGHHHNQRRRVPESIFRPTNAAPPVVPFVNKSERSVVTSLVASHTSAVTPAIVLPSAPVPMAQTHPIIDDSGYLQIFDDLQNDDDELASIISQVHMDSPQGQSEQTFMPYIS